MRVNNSFITRNRTLSGRQKDFYDCAYEKWGLSSDLTTIWHFDEIFANQHNVILEVGFGRGDTLIKNATDNRDNNYIGIEVYRAGILHVLTILEQSQENQPAINNLKVCNGDAKLVIANCITDGSLAGVQIFFPDPWHKRKHVKRRLIQDEFISLLLKKIRKGGFLHLATDWADYAQQMLQVLSRNQSYRNLSANGEYYQCETRLLTKFEQRGLARGHKILDLKFEVI